MGVKKIEELNLSRNKNYQRMLDSFPSLNELASYVRENGVTELERNTGIGRHYFTQKVKPKLKELGLFPSTKEELEEQHAIKLVSFDEAQKVLGTSKTVLQGLIDNGRFKKEEYFVCGVEVEAKTIQGRYYFNKDKIDQLASKYDSTLSEVLKEMGVGVAISNFHKMLQNALTEEEWEEARLSQEHWNKQWLIDNFNEYSTRTLESSRLPVRDYMSYLDDEIQLLIEEYLEWRRKNDYISFDGVDFIKNKIKKDTQVDSQRKNLARAFYRVKCYRAGIKDFSEKDGNKKQLRELSDQEIEQLVEYEFDVKTFNEEDMKNGVMPGIDGNGIYHYRLPLMGFLYFVLMKEEIQYNNNLERALAENNSFDSKKEWTRIKLMKARFERALKLIPKKKPKAKKENRRKKIFARRDQVVKAFKSIYTNEPGSLRYPRKYATQIMLGFLAGIRPVEMWMLKIDEHLDVEKNTEKENYGLLKKYRIELNLEGEAEFIETSLHDPEGWGRIFISEEISKGTYSPSPEYGTLLVPRIVDIVNDYLKELYKMTPGKDKARGFLFRPKHYNPEIHYSRPAQVVDWIPKARESFNFLKEDEAANFSYYETRHTVNNMIVNRTWIDDKRINEWKLRVAETHCRHSMDGSDESLIRAKGETNREHYQELPPLWMYYKVLDTALNYPFDLEELFEYEEKVNPMGNKSLEEELKAKDQKEVLEYEEENEQILTESIDDRLEKLKEERRILRLPGEAKKLRGLEGRERTKQLAAINKEIQLLEKQTK